MKPDLKMEGDKPSVITLPVTIPTASEQRVKPTWSTPKKITVGVILGLVSLVIVTAVVIVSVYYGSKLSHESFKTAQTFMTDKGRVTEETEVSRDEVKIKIPDSVEVVYDYKFGLVVERFIDKETKKRSACFARYMNVSNAPSKDADDYAGDGEVPLNEQRGSEGEKKESWVTTNRKVPRYMVSETVEKLCHDTEIFWMEKTQSGEVEKRAANYLYSTFYTCYATTRPCLYYCYATEVWYDSSTGLYYYVTRWNYYCLKTCAPLYSYC